ncbi:MAG: hypothetical protein PXX77_08085 [Gallionella sp.]|nr:hypothetical protein [Gallionella sp.]
MRFDTVIKVALLCAVTLVSNLVLASEMRVGQKASKAQAHQTKRVLTKHTKKLEAKPAAVVESVVEKPFVPEPGATSDPATKEEISPVDKNVPSLELKGVRG